MDIDAVWLEGLDFADILGSDLEDGGWYSCLGVAFNLSSQNQTSLAEQLYLQRVCRLMPVPPSCRRVASALAIKAAG